MSNEETPTTEQPRAQALAMRAGGRKKAAAKKGGRKAAPKKAAAQGRPKKKAARPQEGRRRRRPVARSAPRSARPQRRRAAARRQLLERRPADARRLLLPRLRRANSMPSNGSEFDDLRLRRHPAQAWAGFGVRGRLRAPFLLPLSQTSSADRPPARGVSSRGVAAAQQQIELRGLLQLLRRIDRVGQRLAATRPAHGWPAAPRAHPAPPRGSPAPSPDRPGGNSATHRHAAGRRA